jgi:hypothetical protein
VVREYARVDGIVNCIGQVAVGIMVFISAAIVVAPAWSRTSARGRHSGSQPHLAMYAQRKCDG